MKIQTHTMLALALLATTLNAASSLALDANSDSSGDAALQAQAATSIDADSMEAQDFGPVHGGGFHPAPGPIGPHPVGPGPGGFHPGPGPFPGPIGPRPVFPGPGGFHPGPYFPGNPYPVHGGYYPWPHWGHPVFERPVFPFEWERLRVVTCTAENSSGYLFPITEDAFFGFAYQARMEQIEDAALDRCYAETNGDPSCVLLGCTAGY